jgi:hypothetical protein
MKEKKLSKRQDVPPPSPSKVPLPPSSSTNSLPSLLETLSSRLTDTEEALSLLLDSPSTLTEQVDSLPLLDRAKFYVTLTYAIDSLIFCYLRTRGANVKDHPVMQELERVKNYIRKVNAAEQAPTDRNLVVDQPAVQRMILHSIPKSQIVSDPKVTNGAKSAGSGDEGKGTGKRVVEEISSDESSSEEGEVRPTKKSKKCILGRGLG